MGNFLQAALDEERRLLAELANIPTFQQLEAVRQVIVRYGPIKPASHSSEPKIPAVASSAMNGSAPRHRTGDRPAPSGSKTAQIYSLAEDYLRKTGKRAKSGELLSVLIESGISIGGKKPPAVVSSYLSGAKQRFHNNHFGYGLPEWSKDGDGAPPSEPEGAP